MTADKAGRKMVLVVDDEPDIRECICEVLNLEGYETISAEDGRQALEAMAVSLPKLVLLDVSMPIMDGHEFMQELRTRGDLSSVPVVIMTAGRTSPNGAVGLLQKPCEVDTLLDCVARHCAA